MRINVNIKSFCGVMCKNVHKLRSKPSHQGMPVADHPVRVSGIGRGDSLRDVVYLEQGNARVAAHPRDNRCVGARLQGHEDGRVVAGRVLPRECVHG